MAAVNRKAAGGAALATPGRPRCELERWIDTYGEGATGAAYGRMNLRNVYANGQQVAGLDEAGKIDVWTGQISVDTQSESPRLA
ncbi:hypothetical protein [Pseudoxanthomonas mexicana]